ncbi:MAG TPA: hypothetical protein VHB21_01265 [Minicystis sp.]|nr:hypothetical protein [Minicystis sp.]
MRTLPRAAAAALLGASALAVALPASADPTKKDEEYGYIFHDDPLQAMQDMPAESRIRVLRVGHRDRLMRLRVQFVTEMLKSVENM